MKNFHTITLEVHAETDHLSDLVQTTVKEALSRLDIYERANTLVVDVTIEDKKNK